MGHFGKSYSCFLFLDLEGAVPALNYLLAALAKNINLLLLFIMLLYEPAFEMDKVLGADLNGCLHALWQFATVI